MENIPYGGNAIRTRVSAKQAFANPPVFPDEDPDGLHSPSVPNEKGEACLSEEERAKTLVLMGTPRSSLRRSVALIWKQLAVTTCYGSGSIYHGL